MVACGIWLPASGSPVRGSISWVGALAKLPARIGGHGGVLIEQVVAATAAVGDGEVSAAGPVVDARNLQRAAERATQVVTVVRCAAGGRILAQLIRGGVEHGSAEGIVRGRVVGILAAAAAADDEIAASARPAAAA